MNLVLLVEGAETEPKVHEAWLRQRLPTFRRAANVANLTTDGYVLTSGGGYPSYSRRLAEILGDIDDHPGKVHAFWVTSRASRSSWRPCAPPPVAERLAQPPSPSV